MKSDEIQAAECSSKPRGGKPLTAAGEPKALRPFPGAAKGRRSRPHKENAAPKTLGPVSDLERHLPSDWWRHLFNSLYLKTDGDVVENARATRVELDRILAVAEMVPGDRILDLCCGQGRHVLGLARRGFGAVDGVDRSNYLVRLARKRAREEQLAAKFREGDARAFRNPAYAYDFVLILGNSFGYFEQQRDDLAVLETVRTALREGGTLVLDLADGDWMRENFQARTWEWIDTSHFVCRERALAADDQRLISREVITHADKGVIADQFYAERLYSAEGIQRLLQQGGFEDIVCHGGFEGLSDRDQDLGMMAHRLLITARAPAAPQGPADSHEAPLQEVLVLLGDPSLPDPVKVNGKFNPEDLATVGALKAALGQLSGYRFRYLDKHAEYLTTLQRLRPKLVLNLCDEGFGNQPAKELHVPALLELLELPYTGGGPGCLAECYDKSLVRSLAASLDIPVPFETFQAAGDSSSTLPSAFPVLIKPNCGDSSMGITRNAVVYNTKELLEYVQWLQSEFGSQSILLQEFLPGRELSIGIVGNPGLSFTVLPALEVDYSGLDAKLPRILGYESKWLPDSPYWSQIQYREAELHEEDLRRVSDYSLTLFERLGCRDYARFDFRSDAEGTLKLLEVNPNPGWCWDGKFNLMAGFAGIEYPRLLEMVLEAASERLLHSRRVALRSS